MAYYDPLVALWPTLAGTTQQKLATVNAMTVAGPNVDVPISAVVGNMILSGAYLALANFAAGATNSNPTHDAALAYAKVFMALVTSPNAPPVAMSNPTSYAVIKGMMDAILAQELAVPGSTGFTQGVHDGLLALATGPTKTWCQANGYPNAQNGGGGITPVDLANAGGLV